MAGTVAEWSTQYSWVDN